MTKDEGNIGLGYLKPWTSQFSNPVQNFDLMIAHHKSVVFSELSANCIHRTQHAETEHHVCIEAHYGLLKKYKVSFNSINFHNLLDYFISQSTNLTQ